MEAIKIDHQTSQLDAVSVQTFTYFPELATEVRLKIWGHAIEAIPPRILELEYHPRNANWHCPTPSNVAPITLLHTCHEAREEASQVFQHT